MKRWNALGTRLEGHNFDFATMRLDAQLALATALYATPALVADGTLTRLMAALGGRIATADASELAQIVASARSFPIDEQTSLGPQLERRATNLSVEAASRMLVAGSPRPLGLLAGFDELGHLQQIAESGRVMTFADPYAPRSFIAAAIASVDSSNLRAAQNFAGEFYGLDAASLQEVGVQASLLPAKLESELRSEINKAFIHVAKVPTRALVQHFADANLPQLSDRMDDLRDIHTAAAATRIGPAEPGSKAFTTDQAAFVRTAITRHVPESMGRMAMVLSGIQEAGKGGMRAEVPLAEIEKYKPYMKADSTLSSPQERRQIQNVQLLAAGVGLKKALDEERWV